MADNILNRRVISDKGVVTYRLLSRLLNCHVNEAKKHLEAFRSKNAETCHASYIVSGTLKTPAINGHAKSSLEAREDDEMVVDHAEAKADEAAPKDVLRTVFELVQEDELEACKSRFDSIISVFVYSLQRKRLNDISLLVAANKQIDIDEKSKKNVAASGKGAKFGVIQLPPRKNATKKKGPLPPSSPVPDRSLGTKTVKEEKPQVAAKTEEKPRKTVKAEEKPRMSDAKGKGKATTSEEMDLMSWDDAAEEEMLRMEREGDDDQTPDAPAGETSMQVDPPALAPALKQRIRKKRKVKKTVRDEKGNRRTEEVEESYSEDEAEDEKKPILPKAPDVTSAGAAPVQKPAPAKKPIAPPQGNLQKPKPKSDEHGQTSLKGFFAKPPGSKKK